MTEDLEAVRDRIVRQLFAEIGGVPPEMEQGWAALSQLRDMRKKIGYPLPPGGALIIGFEAVIAGCMAELHNNLALTLDLDHGLIKLRLERDLKGHLVPIADVELPDNFFVPIVAQGIVDPNKAAEHYLGRVLEAANVEFRRTVTERLGGIDNRRDDLMQAVNE